MANKAILRPYTQLPTMEDVINKFNGAKKFSKLDLREAYHQFEITTESRKITTFYGPDGLYRYKRLNYGTRSAQHILQNEMRNILAGIPNQINIADDILTAGSVEEHDRALELVLSRLRDNGMTVNTGKCLFDVEETPFVGHVFNKEGIQPEPAKVEALHLAGPPKSKKELRSLLGMAEFSERFIPNYSNITAPLRELLKSTWDWDEKYQQAFEELQQALQEDTLLQPYEIGRETQLVVDASLGGLGAVLLQKRSTAEGFRPVVFKSRSLNAAESNYSTSEREALAIRWGIKKLRKYLLGAQQFRVITDHKPLQAMFNKTAGDLPPRIEKFIMDVQEYEYVVEYCPGTTNIGDYLSRHPREHTSNNAQETDEFARTVVGLQRVMVVDNLAAVIIQEIREETRKDATLTKLQQTVRTGQNEGDDELASYMTAEVKYDLHVIDGVIYRGKRLIVPESLQRRVIKLGHEDHQGISKTKSFMRQFCWFPGLDAKVERQIKECLDCLSTQPCRSHEPIKASELPKGPWQFVEMDFQGPYPNGEYIFVMIDRYSSWPEIAFFRQPPTAKTSINVMKSIFANKGIPEVCQSDNGQPFQSAEIKSFAAKQEFVLKHITPEWPRANGTVERFNRCMKEAIQAGHVEGKRRHNFLPVLQSEPTYDNKEKSICSYARGTRDANENAYADLP